MKLSPAELTQNEAYKILIGSILPRPIAWVSTMNENGNLNLAPYSFFTVASSRPMTLVFCPQLSASGTKKDTLHNVEAVPEFVVNITNEDTAEQMNMTATVLPPDQSEFEWAGLTPAPSETIRVPRVVEAPISFECRLKRIVTLGEEPGGGSAVFGEGTMYSHSR